MSKNVLLRKEQCPDCASNGGDTSKDNLAVYSDGQTHCFACGTHGFTEHSNKLVEVANLACSMSANEDGVKMVRYAAQQIQNTVSRDIQKHLGT